MCHGYGRTFNDLTASPIAGTHYPELWQRYSACERLSSEAEELDGTVQWCGDEVYGQLPVLVPLPGDAYRHGKTEQQLLLFINRVVSR